MTLSQSAPLIHFWTPGLFDFKGGIQTYSGFLLQAIETLYPQAQIRVFSTHDRPRPAARFRGYGGVAQRLRIPAYAADIIGAGMLERPDLILSTHASFSPAAAWLKRLANIPYWIIAHGFEVWNLQRRAVQAGLRVADRILPVSHYTRDRMAAEQQIPLERFTWLPNTFDVDRFHYGPKPDYLLEKYGLRPDQPVVLTVNRLAAGEDFHAYDQVLRSLPRLRQHLPDIHYIIVGKGDDRDRVTQLIQQLNLSKHVTLAGFIPDESLPDYYHLCDVFAMPSKLEGFGIVFLEALACGKPVLAGNQDGSVDAVNDGRLGALVDPDATEQIAQTLLKILNKTYSNPLLYQPAALRQAVVDLYGPTAFQQRVGQLFQNS